MLGLIINTLILGGAIWIVARHDADFQWWKLALIALGINLLGAVLAVALASALGWFGLILLIPIMLAISSFLINRFLYLTWRDAVISSVVYVVAQIGFSILWGIITSPSAPPA